MSKIFRLFLKLYIVAAIVLAVSALHSCSVSQSEGKTEPEYKGVDPQLQPLVNEYLLITSKNNVVFNNQVTLGIKDIDGGAVGLCNYGKKWREIDIDKDFWERSSPTTRKATLFHELTHCYCGRDHDYGDGKTYKSVEELKEESRKGIDHEGGGFFKDNCPISLMYPIVVDNACMDAHYSHYVKEMLERCEPF